MLLLKYGVIPVGCQETRVADCTCTSRRAGITRWKRNSRWSRYPRLVWTRPWTEELW